ncbi:MAG: hypothetical protein OHK0039_17950 [Bacteroidia bacterium]
MEETLKLIFAENLREVKEKQPSAASSYHDEQAVQAAYFEVLQDLSEIDAHDICYASRFREDLGLDSLDMVELVMICEKQFEVILPDQEWMRAKTVGDFFNMLRGKVCVYADATDTAA